MPVSWHRFDCLKHLMQHQYVSSICVDVQQHIYVTSIHLTAIHHHRHLVFRGEKMHPRCNGDTRSQAAVLVASQANRAPQRGLKNRHRGLWRVEWPFFSHSGMQSDPWGSDSDCKAPRNTENGVLYMQLLLSCFHTAVGNLNEIIISLSLQSEQVHLPWQSTHLIK